MADNLLFPIGFDLEAAVKKAESEGASAMKRLETVFSRQPLALRLDNSGFEKFSAEFGKNIDQLKARLKELSTHFDAIPLNQKWEQNNGVKTLTAHAKELWDELLRITEILKSVGQGAQQMANQSIREIDKEIAALEKLKQKEIEARQAKQTKQLQTEWNAAADRHKKDTLAEEKRLQEESSRIRIESEAIARREAEIEKLIVEHKVRQMEAQQAKKRSSDEEYANLVRQLREEERLSAEKARQKALDMRRERQSEATAALERERAARRRLLEAKLQQWRDEQKIINSQEMSYDALMAKLQTWQRIQNRVDVGSKKWEAATVAIRQTKEMLALVTDEMAKSERAAERLRKLREILSANERTVSGLNAKLAEYNSRIQGLDVGSTKFDKTALEIRRLTEELQKATQQMQDFQQRSFQGVSDSLTKGRVQALTQMREQLQQIDADFNRLNQTGTAFNTKGGLTSAANDVLRQREAIIKQINQMLVTASDAQIQREKEINHIVEQRKAKADAIAAKRKAEQAAIQENISKLKAERRILNQQESTIANITAKLQIQQQRLQYAKFDSAEFERISKEVERLTNKLDKANQKVRELTGQVQSGAGQQSAAAKQVSQEFSKQDSYITNLLKKTAALWSVHQVGSFLTNIREVTAQFELQRISLGAIIQDQARANQLFEEIKTFALKSPVKILDLTKYTKQLAAYKIGVDELFDTTKRLTDISVGLGVSMDRIVLMYGQIRATGYLRASEVRQATEAGIPLVEELANKLSKANGELVTAANVMDMISKRAISFDMVKEVFNDMTSAGGIFYNMQEKQGNTLYGMWQKLGDAAAVMYDQIGNTSSVNGGMKMAIQSLRYLMLHWKQVGIVVGGVSVYILANTIATKNNAIATAAATTANQTHVATLERKLAALRLEQMHLKSSSIFVRLHTAATISATKAQIGAATSTNVFSKALYGLKAALLSNPLTALAVALTTIIALFMQSESELDKLNSKLQDIDRDYDASGKKSVDRFKELVKAVEENVDGSKAQKEALDELDRTYGKILGSEALELDRLKALGGQYAELIDLIEAYNAKKRGEEKKTAIESTSATIKDEAKDDLMDYLNQAGMSKEKQIEFMARLNEKLIEYAGQADAAIKATDETFKEFADDISQLDSAGNILNVLDPDKLFDAWGVGFRAIGGWFGGKGMSYLYDYANAMQKERELLEENEIATRNAVRGLDEYAEGIDNVGKALKNLDWSSQEALYNSLQDYNKKNPQTALSVPIKLEFDPTKAQSEYEKMIEIGNMQIHAIFANLQSIASQEGVAIPEEFYKQAKSVVEGNKSFSFIDFEGLSKLFTSKKAKQAVAESKLLFESISPNDRTVAVFRAKLAQLASGAGVELSTMTKYFMNAGDNIEDYAKKIKEAIEELEKKLNEMQTTNQMIAEGGHGPLQVFSEEEIKKIQMQVAVLKELFPFLQGFTKGSGRTSDPRLQTLQEIANKMAEVNKEYDELLKKEGQTKALADTQKLFASSFEQMESTAEKYGFKLPAFEVPQTIEDVQSWYKAIMDNIKRLGLKNADKVLIELGFKSDKAAIDKQQKEIESHLKALSERISRTRTANEFYERMLEQTGDVGMAARLASSIFGENGEELNREIAERLCEMVESTSVTLPEYVFNGDMSVNTKVLKGWVTANKTALGDVAKELTKFADDSENDTAKMVEGWLKATEKAKTYSDKLVQVYLTTSMEIKRIEAEMSKGNLGQSEGGELIAGFRRKEAQEIANLQYEAFKDSPMYVQVFDDLDHASTRMLENMKSRLQGLQGQWKNLGPTQLKEMQSRMREIDEQLAKRNPFKVLSDSLKEYRQLRTKGDSRGNKSRKSADRDAADWTAKRLAAEEELARVMADSGATEAQKAGAKQMVDYTKKHEAEALKAAENWKKVEDAIGLSSNELFQMLNWASDIAKGIADISEVMGADEEDVQYWNDVADALGQISGGIQDIVSAAMSGNMVGIISSTLTAIPKMFVGFANLFSAGTIKRANKEIKHQQEILEGLEYAYGRLEKAAEGVFGRDYISNFNRQLEVMEARAEAYRKQEEAERSKGKKADDDKLREYADRRRDVLDEIADMEGALSEHFAGMSRTDAARRMAESWIEARSSMSDTFAAIRGDYSEMIKKMIVEGAAARVMENALAPMWEQMEDSLGRNDVTGAIDALVGGMDVFLSDANEGMEVLWSALEARGYDMRSLLGTGDEEYTGMKRGVAGATSEEMNANTTALNTQNYYIAQQLAEVQAIRALLTGGVSLPDGGGWSSDFVVMQNAALDHLSAINRNTADTVNECRRVAAQCERIALALHRVVAPVGTRAGHAIRVEM